MRAPTVTVLLLILAVCFLAGVLVALDQRYALRRRIWKPWAVILVRSPYQSEHAAAYRGVLIRQTYRVWTHRQARTMRARLRVEFPFAAVRIKAARRLP